MVCSSSCGPEVELHSSQNTKSDHSSKFPTRKMWNYFLQKMFSLVFRTHIRNIFFIKGTLHCINELFDNLLKTNVVMISYSSVYVHASLQTGIICNVFCASHSHWHYTGFILPRYMQVLYINQAITLNAA